MDVKVQATIAHHHGEFPVPHVLGFSIALVIEHEATEIAITASKHDLQAMLTRNLVERLKIEAEKLDPEAVQWRWV